MLQHAHPAKFVAEILDVIWAFYFRWNQNWIGAVECPTVSGQHYRAPEQAGRIPGRIVVRKSDAGLQHAINFIMYNVSALPVI